MVLMKDCCYLPQCREARKPGRDPGLFCTGSSRFVQGFSLVELAVVIVIAGILAAVVLPRLTSETGFEARKFRDETVAALRFAQKSAIATRRKVCAAFSAGQVSFAIAADYTSADCSGGPDYYGADMKTPVVVTAPSGVAFSAFPATLVFDSAGRPDAGVSIKVSGLPDSLSVKVEAETGYVH